MNIMEFALDFQNMFCYLQR